LIRPAYFFFALLGRGTAPFALATRSLRLLILSGIIKRDSSAPFGSKAILDLYSESISDNSLSAIAPNISSNIGAARKTPVNCRNVATLSLFKRAKELPHVDQLPSDWSYISRYNALYKFLPPIATGTLIDMNQYAAQFLMLAVSEQKKVIAASQWGDGPFTRMVLKQFFPPIQAEEIPALIRNCGMKTVFKTNHKCLDLTGN